MFLSKSTLGITKFVIFCCSNLGIGMCVEKVDKIAHPQNEGKLSATQKGEVLAVQVNGTVWPHK